MTLQFSLGTAAPETVDCACVLVGVYEQGVLTDAAARLDSATGGAIKRQVESGDISGKAGSPPPCCSHRPASRRSACWWSVWVRRSRSTRPASRR